MSPTSCHCSTPQYYLALATIASANGGTVPPILFPTVICLSPVAPDWRRLACRVLPDLTVAAAMRPNAWPGPLTLLPVARSPSRSRCRAPLVGSYPTVSPLTAPHERRRDCSLLRL